MTTSASKQLIPGETTRSKRSPWTQRSHVGKPNSRRAKQEIAGHGDRGRMALYARESPRSPARVRRVVEKLQDPQRAGHRDESRNVLCTRGVPVLRQGRAPYRA